ncbi:MAG: transcription elongation factor GreA [Chloroflexota bacterium]|nr:transcription elongation factor GreA [Chloroflexota bacterium]
MRPKKVFLTPEGKRELEEELEYLRTVRRKEVAQRIHEAKEDGDIMESAEYEDAKNEQAFVEGRILTLEALLKNVVLIEEEGPTDQVGIGSWVTVVRDSREESEVYRIVDSAEADPTRGFISHHSPIGGALMGHQAGEKVEVTTPGGTVHLRILRIGQVDSLEE